MGLHIIKSGSRTPTVPDPGGNSNGKLGTPTDGSWINGKFVLWSEDTTISDALDDVSEELKLVDNKITTLETTVEGITEDITNLNITGLSETIDQIRLDITNMDLDTIVDDIAALKIDNTTNKTDIATLKIDNITNKTDITILKTDNITIKDDIELLKTDNTTNKTDIVTLKTDNTTNKDDIALLKTDMVTVKAKTATLTGDMQNVKEDIIDITDRLDNLQVGGGTPSDGTLGNPQDGSWTDGFFDSWTNSTLIKNAIDDISEAFLDLAPVKAGLLAGTSLTSNMAFYIAKLSSGLDTKWYTGGKNPGDTISTYMITHSGILSTPNTSTIFRAGKKATPTSYGVLKLFKNSTEVSSYDMSAGVGSNGVLNVTSIAAYNTIWNKANATVTLTLTDEGKLSFSLFHTEAGTTNNIELWHDPANGLLSFATNPVVVVTTPVYKNLSGKQYLTIGTALTVTYKAAVGIFNKAYHATSVSTISGSGLVSTVVNPTVVPAYNDNFDVTKLVVLNSANQASNNPTISVQLFRPETSISASANIAGKVCTYGTMSTATTDSFYDEARRVYLGTNTAFDSAAILPNGEAQVGLGVLNYGLTDYPSKTGNQEYQRMISKTTASSGTLTLGGLSRSNIAPYGTGNVNVLIYLEGDDMYYDLAKAFGDINGTGSGKTRENSIGAWVSGTSTMNWTIGTNSTAGVNNQQYRLIIVFRNSTNTISSIAST